MYTKLYRVIKCLGIEYLFDIKIPIDVIKYISSFLRRTDLIALKLTSKYIICINLYYCNKLGYVGKYEFEKYIALWKKQYIILGNASQFVIK